MAFLSENELKTLRARFKPGTRVELIRMDDVQAPPAGTRGTVRGVDDIGSILVSWDNGSSLNVVYGEDICKGVALKLASCMLEQLLEGKKVQFSDLGTFYLSAKTSGAATEDDFNVGQNIRGLYLRFSPSRQDAKDLSAKSLKKLATFLNAKDLVEPKKKDGNENENGNENG